MARDASDGRGGLTMARASELALAMPRQRLAALLRRQLGSLFEFDEATDGAALDTALTGALEDVAVCFRPARNKYFHRDGAPWFDPFHSGQNTIFLYYLSRRLARAGATSLADRAYGLNKALNGLDLYHGVEMPAVFGLDHPVGSVIGRATMGEGFFFCQNCTVGSSRGVFPTLGREVTMFAYAAVIGRCAIGDRVILGAGTMVVDQDVPPMSVVTGRSPHLDIRPMTPESFTRRAYFEPALLGPPG
jgi:serine O-acetyltransferase